MNNPVPCMSGQAGSSVGGPVNDATDARIAGSPPSTGWLTRLATFSRREQVVLTPHHALRHAGRATGVEEAEVVPASSSGRADLRITRRRPRRGLPTRSRWRSRGTDRSRRRRGSRPHLRERRTEPRHPIGEAAVEYDRGRVGVRPEECELLVAVAVVRVDRHQARLQGREDGLEVLVAVVEVLGDLVLAPSPASSRDWARPPARRSKSAHERRTEP